MQVWAYETFGTLKENGHCHLRDGAAFPRMNRWRSGSKAIFSKVMEDLYANITVRDPFPHRCLHPCCLQEVAISCCDLKPA